MSSSMPFCKNYRNETTLSVHAVSHMVALKHTDEQTKPTTNTQEELQLGKAVLSKLNFQMLLNKCPLQTGSLS